MIHGLQTIEDLLSKEELYLYQTIARPFHIHVLRKALDKKLKIDPDYEVFVALEFHRYRPMVTKNTELIFRSSKTLASNKGRVCTVKKKKVKFLSISTPKAGYPIVGTKFNWVAEIFLMHRLLACLFVMPDDTLGEYDLSELQINHKDGIKTNYELSNLEWCTSQGNILHAYSTGLNPTKPIAGKVLAGEFKNYEFVFARWTEAKNCGFSVDAIQFCCYGRQIKHKGCSFTYATEEQVKLLPQGLPKRILTTLPPVQIHLRKPILA